MTPEHPRMTATELELRAQISELEWQLKRCEKRCDQLKAEKENLHEREALMEKAIRILLSIEDISLCLICLDKNRKLLETFYDQCKDLADNVLEKEKKG
jgi:hypothetical protein